MSIPMSTATNEYLRYLSTGLNRSPHTIEHYKFSITLLDRYLEDPMLNEIKIEQMLDFEQYLKNRKGTHGLYSPVSLQTRMMDIKTFFRWCRENKEYETINWRIIPIPRCTRNRIDYLQPQEFKSVLRAIDAQRRGMEHFRLKASVFVLWSTGARLAEFINMRMQDINFETGEVIVKGKGSKFGTVYINERAMTHLLIYLHHRDDDCPYVWVSVKDGEVQQMQRAALQQQLKKLGQRAGLMKQLHPHMFRHTMATSLLQNGCDLRAVQMFLRHKNINTTQIYTHYSNIDLRAKHKKYMRV